MHLEKDKSNEVKKVETLKKCPVLNCGTSTLKKYCFYRIPEHPVRRKAWIEATKLPIDCSPKTTICWKHFKFTDFTKEITNTDVAECNFGRLQYNVVPSRCLPNDENFVKTDCDKKKSILYKRKTRITVL